MVISDDADGSHKRRMEEREEVNARRVREQNNENEGEMEGAVEASVWVRWWARCHVSEKDWLVKY